MPAHAYTEDQQAPRTLTRPLPAGEEAEQPAIGLFAEQSALPNPQPGLSATLLPVGEGPGDEGAQLALPPEAITAAVDELARDRSAMSRFSGQVNLKTN
jgi:hypothetical protein